MNNRNLYKAALIAFMLMVTLAAPASPLTGLVYVQPLQGDWVCNNFQPTRIAVYQEYNDTASIGEIINQRTRHDNLGGCYVNSKLMLQLTGVQHELLTLEYDYAAPALLVTAETTGRIRVQTPAGDLWIDAFDGTDYWSLDKLLSSRLSYINTPDGIAIQSEPKGAEGEQVWPYQTPINFLQSSVVDGQLWLQIQIMSHTICDAPDEAPRVIEAGWIPAHDAQGNTNAWFHSRGC